MSEIGVSVVTVALNASDDLPLSIESVLNQDHRDIEYLIVDGMSWDKSYDVLRRYKNCPIDIVQISDGGIYDAMNITAKMASKEYIYFLNAGDRFCNFDSISSMLSRVISCPDIIYGDHIYVDGRTETFQRSADFGWLVAKLQEGRIDSRWHRLFPAHQATFTRTALLRAMQYDTGYTICADHDFLFRAYEAGYSLQYVDEIVAHYVAGGVSGAEEAKVRREWAHCYRRRSYRPELIDQFFLGEQERGAFVPVGLAAGAIRSGATHAAGGAKGLTSATARGLRWFGDLDVLSPHQFPAVGLRLGGINPSKCRTCSVLVGGVAQHQVEIPAGAFDLRIGFRRPLLGGESVVLSPAGMDSDGAAQGGVTLQLFDLDFIRAPAVDGASLDANDGRDGLLGRMMVSGWSDIEPGNGLVWSTAESCSLAGFFADPVDEIVLACRANPAVAPPGLFGGGRQTLTVLVNGLEVGCFRLRGRKVQQCPMDVRHAWQHGVNIISFCVDQIAQPGNDTRTLGFALLGLRWRRR